ncbi:hypothetical protein ACJRO7_027871 [Eucalyptus globulus]|uniref:Mechanosensitive ion channel protein n=1 Tax=Eucalyptus globulus TaxID=34317 RepID=A0ABD3K5G6_EUCGL
MLRDPSIGSEKGSEEKAPAEGSGRALDDRPSPLIGRSLHQQWTSRDLSLDVGLEIEELRGSDGSRMLRDPSIGSEKGSEEKAPAEGSGRALDNRPSPLIGRSLHQQWTSRDLSLDVGLEIEELRGSDGSRMLRDPSIGSEKGSEEKAPAEGSGRALDNRPSPLIGRSLHQQWTSRDLSLDVELEIEELHGSDGSPPAPRPQRQSQDGSRVSCQPPIWTEAGPGVPQRWQEGSPSSGRDGNTVGNREEEVTRRTSSATSHRSYLLCSKSRSRMMDPPEEPQQRSGHIPRSGMLGRAGDEDEDDIFLEEDLPEELRKTPFGAMALLQWVSLVLIVGALVCTLVIPASKHKDLWKFKLWKWEVLVLVLICGRLVSGWMFRLAVFFMERNFLLRKRVLYFFYSYRNAVQNCLWLGLVSIAWRTLFDINGDGLRYVTKVLLCCLEVALLWLIKTLIFKVLASSFHVRTYFERIQKSLFNQYVIEKLSGPPVIEIRSRQEEENLAGYLQTLQEASVTVPPELRAGAFPTESGMVVGSGGLQRSPRVKNTKLSQGLSGNSKGGITIEHLYNLNPKNVSAWNMKRLINMVRHGLHSTLDERIQDSTEEDESATMIRSVNEAKAAARKIFRNVAKPNSKFIYLEDLKRFMKDDEALNTMRLFEGADECKRISKSCLTNWLVNAFRGRRALDLTLNDTKIAVKKLRDVINVIVGFIVLLTWVLILGAPTMKFLFIISSQLVPLAFLFGNTCKTIFEATLFLFVMHPYDVGDRCEIDGVELVVEEINILTTVFLRDDDQKIVYPNSTLATKAIGNYYRSPDMADEIEFCVHIATPAEKIAAMKDWITGYVDDKKEYWHSSPMIIMKDIEELNSVRIVVWLYHTMNHQDMDEKYTRRSLLIEEMVKMFRELDIQYRLLPLDINVRAMPALSSTRVPPAWENAG